jgi:hypothetical protein
LFWTAWASPRRIAPAGRPKHCGHDRPNLSAPLVFDGLMDALAADWIASRLGAELTAAMPDLPATLTIRRLTTPPGG